MGATSFLQDLVVVMVVAAAATLLAQRLRQPVVLGYIVAGVLIGPHTRPFSLVTDHVRIHELAELGLIFLLFSLGLEFNFRKVQRVGSAAVVGAAVEIAAMLVLGYAVGQAFGWSHWDSVFLGAILSVSSTTIIVKVLTDQGKVTEEFAEVAFGILIVEDLLVLMLAGILGGGDAGFLSTTSTALWVVVFAVVGAGVGLTLIPRFVEGVARRHTEEILVVTVVGLAFASSLLAQHLGFSLALGAFIMGALIGESGAVRKVEHKVAPIRHLFSSTFFVAVGMLLDPVLVWEHRWAVLAVTLVAVLGKILACTLGAWLAGREPAVALRVGFTMGQIGEFSFILAGVGLALGLMSPHLYPIAVAVCAITTFTTPYLIRVSDPLAEAVQRSRWGRAGSRYRAALAERRGSGAPVRGRAGVRALVGAGWAFALAFLLALGGGLLVARSSLPDAASQSATFVLTLVALAVPAVLFQRAAREIAAFRGKRRTLRNLSNPGPLPGGFRPAALLASYVATGLLVALAVAFAWEAFPRTTPPVPLAAACLVLVGAAAFALRRSLLRVARGAETLALAAVPEDAGPGPLERIRARAPWGMDAAEVSILEGSAAAYRALGELDLRRRTGAIAVHVSRAGERIPAPDAELALLPGDRLIVIGRHEQIERARDLLTSDGRSTALEAGRN